MFTVGDLALLMIGMLMIATAAVMLWQCQPLERRAQLKQQLRTLPRLLWTTLTVGARVFFGLCDPAELERQLTNQSKE